MVIRIAPFLHKVNEKLFNKVVGGDSQWSIVNGLAEKRVGK